MSKKTRNRTIPKGIHLTGSQPLKGKRMRVCTQELHTQSPKKKNGGKGTHLLKTDAVIKCKLSNVCVKQSVNYVIK